MKVLVTGATGYLGGRVAERLAEAGHEVRGLVRDPARWVRRPDGAEAVVGDVTDVAAVAKAAEGCGAVVHAAALVKSWVRDRGEFDRVNLGGFRNATQGARAAGAKLVYASSFIALGPTDGTIFDEETPRASARFHNDYERTKWVADQAARSLARDGFPIVRLYPGVVYGPGELTDGNHVVRLLLQHARGRLPGYLGRGDLRQCFAYVDDVATGFVAAVERAAPGSGYILGGENRTARELFAALEDATGIVPPRRSVPFWVAGVIGKLERWRAEITSMPPELTDEIVGVYRHEWAYSSAKAERDLGYRITPLREGIARTAAWLRETGELPGSR
ncbi:MAG: NAD-dependent epimerase/dehydratase family protein [Acidobacteriia bacterium]|nr:NAD-dependent epimerase/dehydratase family protein [Terriglobia bacterium]